MDAILGTSRIRWVYPKDRQQPKSFRVQVGRSSGVYTTYDVVIGPTLNNPEGVWSIDPLFFVDGSVTGTYYVRISSVHYDNTEVAGSEFTINVVEPADAVIAPIAYVV
jgi:hypothetical protein